MSAPIRKKLLIVDDERDLVEPLGLRLSAMGRYELAYAYDGHEGLLRALEFRPHIALVDLAMPGLDGWELCRKLRGDARTRDIELIIMTAWLSLDLGRRAKSEGVSRLLLKPFEDDDLIEALEPAKRAPPAS